MGLMMIQFSSDSETGYLLAAYRIKAFWGVVASAQFNMMDHY